MDGSNETIGRPRVETLAAVADLGMTGLVAKGADLSGQLRGWVLQAGAWRADRATESPLALDELLDLAGNGNAITFTAVYAGCEERLGIDRDLDGYLDRDELDLGSDPGDPGSVPDPATVPGGPLVASSFRFEPVWPNPASRAARVAFELPGEAEADVTVYDVTGRQVRQLAESVRGKAGRNEAGWNLEDDAGRDVPSGLYFVQIRVDGDTRTRRLVVRR
jgi:hypothetical protein